VRDAGRRSTLSLPIPIKKNESFCAKLSHFEAGETFDVIDRYGVRLLKTFKLERNLTVLSSWLHSGNHPWLSVVEALPPRSNSARSEVDFAGGTAEFHVLLP
jgi:hypothetical protein